MSTRLRYECDEDGTAVEIQIADGEGLTGSDFVERLVAPMMLGIGYQPNAVKEALGNE